MSEEEDKTISSTSSVAALKARFSGKSPPPANSISIPQSSKSDMIRTEITTGRRMSVKDMANKFKDPTSMNDEQRLLAADGCGPPDLVRSSSRLIDELMNIRRGSVRDIAAGFKGESTLESREAFFARQQLEIEAKRAKRTAGMDASFADAEDEEAEEVGVVTYREADMFRDSESATAVFPPPSPLHDQARDMFFKGGVDQLQIDLAAVEFSSVASASSTPSGTDPW